MKIRLTVFLSFIMILAASSCQMDSGSSTSSASVPSAPSISSVTAMTTTSVKVAWSTVSGASGYYVYKSASEDGTYSKTNTISSSATLYATVTGLTAGTTYYFKVSAYNSAGESSLSAAANGTTVAAATAVPDAPSSVSATATSSTAVTVTWDNVSTANGYKVYSSADNSTYSLAQTISDNATLTSSVTGLTASTTYYFKVSAYNDVGEGSLSSYCSAVTDDSSTRDISATSSDKIENNTFTNTIYINLATPSFSVSSADDSGTTITSTAASIGSTGITAVLSDGVISIDASSATGMTDYILTGTMTGSFAVTASKSNLAITLNGVNITSGNYPPIEVEQKKKTAFIILPDGTTNTLTDGRKYGYGYGYGSSYETTSANYVASGEDTKGSLYAKGPLIITPSTSTGTGGSLSVTTAYKHSIYSKDYIRMFGGTITTANSGRNGIQSVNGFIMESGTVNITGTGTNTNNQSRGIVVEGEESDSYPGEGYILINGGTITTNTVGKAMTAKWDIDDDASTTATTDDPDPYVKITAGTITITTTGTPKDESSSAVTFTDADGVSTSETTSLSPEGIEGKQAVYISGGTITLNTTDDGINASRSDTGEIDISGGTIYVFSSDNDAIDSNGTLTISGGTIVAITTTNPECAFDCDDNTFTVTGGLIVGMGTSNFSSPTTSACTQNTVVMAASYAPAGGTMAVCTSSGTPVFAFTVPALSSVASTGGSNTYDVLIFSSPDLASSTTYTVYKNAAISGGTTYNGLYLAPSSKSAGTSETTFTTSSTVTTVGTVSNNGSQEGPHQ